MSGPSTAAHRDGRDPHSCLRFVDRPPATIQAILADRGTYLCSTRTMYRILDAAQEVKERRRQATHPVYVKPELCASAPNQVWSWDITDLKGPVRGSRYKLYVTIDLFSRLVVGWTLQHREDEDLAKEFHRQNFIQHGIGPWELTLHSDRGPAMVSRTVGNLLIDLKVTKSHGRPHVSDDNPYSESQFKTLKYSPGFPERFGSIEDARSFCRGYFHWYNYRSITGARTGDTFMSLIHSAELNGVEPFEYLIELLKHPEEVRQNPARWMPWSYPAPADSG